MRTNSLGQPIGEDVPDWKPALYVPRAAFGGRYATIEPVEPARHAPALYEALEDEQDASSWTYMGYGPFASLAAYEEWLTDVSRGTDPFFFAIIDNATQKPVGVASYLRVDPRVGSIEIGNIHYSPRLKRTRIATEAMYLFMRRAFEDLGYRRYEWKCDALNAPSRRAAERYGFTYEGTFRQHMMYKGRNRDTAWFAIIHREWPALKEAYETWLDPSNFDEQGHQRTSLGRLTAKALGRP